MNDKYKKLRQELIDLFHEFDGEKKEEFIKRFPEIWDDCYDIMEDSRYHRVMKNCVLAGFDTALKDLKDEEII